ncbi:MAG: 30S ribosomal protein S6 [bacterium]|nr:30S ribosomal protein S6 [bacterium]
MNKYEFTFLLKEEKDEEIVKKLLASLGVTIANEKKWGKRSLAYPINKLTSLFFFTWTIEHEKAKMKELKQKLDFMDNVERFLILKEDEA